MANKMLGLLGRLLGAPYASNYVVGVLPGTRDPDAEVERARKTLSDHNAYSLKHFGDGTITDLDSA